MTTMYVTYEGEADARFDRDYWLTEHFALVRGIWGPLGLDSVTGFFPASENSGVVAIAPCRFRDEAAMKAALASPDSKQVMDDVKMFTDISPRKEKAVPL